MAFNPSIAVSQAGQTPNSATVTDNSTGTDAAITVRHIFVQDAFGVYLTGDGTVNYDVWDIADSSITFSFLTEDIGANILVNWVNVLGGTLYTFNGNYPLSEIGKQFFYYLLQTQGLTPGIYMDTNYAMNLAMYWVNLIAGDHAVSFGNDLSAAQNCYTRETQMRLQQNNFF